MSDTHDEAHTGAIKNPKQFLTSTILAFVLPIFIIIGLVVFVAVTVVVHACEQHGSRRGARCRDVEVGEAHPAARQGVKMGGRDFTPKGADIGEAPVIGDQHHDVRACVSGGLHKERSAQSQHQEPEPFQHHAAALTVFFVVSTGSRA